jgi:hypothetical protein
MTPKQLALTALLAVVALVAFRALTRKPRPQPSPQDPNADMPILAAKAVDYAAARGVTLDYAPSSVERVESLLADLHRARTAGQLPDDQLHAHAARFGAYIGEVLRRQYGGHWTQDHDVAGPNSFPIHWKDGQSFPIAWCGKRILNGDEDNVWFKFQAVTSDDYLHRAITPQTHPTD